MPDVEYVEWPVDFWAAESVVIPGTEESVVDAPPEIAM